MPALRRSTNILKLFIALNIYIAAAAGIQLDHVFCGRSAVYRCNLVVYWWCLLPSNELWSCRKMKTLQRRHCWQVRLAMGPGGPVTPPTFWLSPQFCELLSLTVVWSGTRGWDEGARPLSLWHGCWDFCPDIAACTTVPQCSMVSLSLPHWDIK